VQLYGSADRLLADNVRHYLSEGCERGDRILVIATRPHIEAFCKKIECLDSRQLILLDAADTLAEFMSAGQPDWKLFERVIGSAIGAFGERPPGSGLRAYGEMVGLLWNSGKYAAAIRVEQFWNKLLGANSFNLYCAYPIDVFGAEFQVAAVDSLLCAHTHLVPAGANGDLDAALDRSMDDLLGRRAEGLRRLMDANFRPGWAVVARAEANILWLRNNLPDEAESIVDRARQYFQVSNSRTACLQVH
jgi:hypothetical protein